MIHARLRDGLAGLYNLETLLRSPRASSQVLRAVLPELERGTRALAEVFSAPSKGTARAELGAFALARVDLVCEAIAAVPAVIDPRARLALLNAVMRVRPDLEAAVDLLVLDEQSLSPEPTELCWSEVFRVAFTDKIAVARASSAAFVRVRVGRAVGNIMYDARILASILRHSVARAGVDSALVSTQEAEQGSLVAIDSVTAADAVTDPPLPLVRRVPPTDVVLDAVLARWGGSFEPKEGAARLVLRPMM